MFIDTLSENYMSACDEMNFPSALIETPLGTMRAVSDDSYLYSLEFVDEIDSKTSMGDSALGAQINSDASKPVQSIQHELQLYFAGKLTTFKTPLKLTGTSFQNSVWQSLSKVPFGQTRSYLELAKAVNNPKGFRAVARANGANKFVILIPCHRIINSSGKMGGYSAGLMRKEWLLNHERLYSN